MVTTRSMSKTRTVTGSTSKPTKKTDTKMDVNAKQKAAKRATNKAKSGTTKIIATRECTYSKWTAMTEAFLFFLRDRTQKPTGIIPRELRLAVWQEWRDMSRKDKAPFLERAKKLKVEERCIYR